jgi:hypothetical protein
MRSKAYHIVKRWLSDRVYWLKKWEAEHLPLKPVRPHFVVVVVAALLVVATIVSAFIRFDFMPKDNNPTQIESKKCAVWIRDDGSEIKPGTPEAIKETRTLVGDPSAYVDC